MFGRLRREDGSKPMVALAGCVAQAEGAEAKRRSQLIDIVVGPQAYHRLPETIAQASLGARPVDTDMPAISKFDALPARRRAASSAFLTVQEGCDNLHILRRTLHARRGDLAALAGCRRRSAGAGRGRRARDRSARPECECVDRRQAWPRRANPNACEDRWSRAHPLHHEPPSRHDRRTHRRP